MRNNDLFHRPLSWLVFLLLACASAVYVYFNFDKANSLVNVNIQMNREEALKQAARLAEEFEIGPEGFKQAAAFRNDSHFQNFTELESGGLDTFNQIIAEGYYQPYYWSVRHFKEQEASEAVFRFKPNGEKYGFTEKIPETEKGPALTAEEALKIAEHNAIYNWNIDLEPYALVEQSKEEQTNGRVDHTFVYERTAKAVGEGKFRLRLTVSGDRLTAVDHYVKIPENFDRRYSEMRSANDTIATIATAIIVIIYGLFGVIFSIFILLRRRRLIWKPAVFWGIGIALASVFLLSLNSLQFSWFSYDTSTSGSNFLLRQILSSFMGALGFGSIIAVSFMAAEGLDRMAFPRHLQWWKLWSAGTGGTLPVLGRTVAGYLFAVIIIGFDVLFYLVTTTHFGWWSPADTLSDPNILANYFPWLDSIAISLQAGFWEESLFRAVPIAGVFLLTKNKKSRNLWIIVVLVLQTLVFGAAHANYAQQPSYARILEMVVPFTLMGIIYIFYGILPAVIAHFTVDVFWISLPLWVSKSDGIWIDRSFVLLFLFLPLFIVLFIRLRNGRWKKVPEESRNEAWIEHAAPEKTEVTETVTTIQKLNVEKWLVPLGVAGLALWIYFTPFTTDSPVLNLKKQEAVETAIDSLTTKYNIGAADWKVLTSVVGSVNVPDVFVWRQGGESVYHQMIGKFLPPPHWQVRLVKTTGKAEERTEEFVIGVNNDGSIREIIHRIPEKQSGANLTLEEARSIVDSALVASYSVDRNHLKEVSVTPQKQENRTDWEFVYADTVDYPLSEGQGRYEIELSGDEVTGTNWYVHVPEEWVRSYKDTNSKQSVFQIFGNVLIIGTILLGLILAIIRWTRRKFNLKIFIFAIPFFILVYIASVWMNFPNLISAYTTQVPFDRFILTILISMAISGIFISLFNSIFVAATPGWLPVREKPGKLNALYAVALGILMAGILSAVKLIVPKISPDWLSYDYPERRCSFCGYYNRSNNRYRFLPGFCNCFLFGYRYVHKKLDFPKMDRDFICFFGRACNHGTFLS